MRLYTVDAKSDLWKNKLLIQQGLVSDAIQELRILVMKYAELAEQWNYECEQSKIVKEESGRSAI